MTLHELAEQYRESAKSIYERMKEICKLQRGKMCEMELLRLRQRKERLEDMYYDALETARYLDEYYGRNV